VGPVGEPLNVIISALSSPQVLTDAGFLNFARAIGLQVIYYSTSWHLLINRFTSSTECFGIHIGDPQSANLGDGHGWFNQTNELREDYGNPDVGTCLESLIGGNHFRLIGNTYFAFMDGCWVAVDVDGFVYAERVICAGDPEFIVVE